MYKKHIIEWLLLLWVMMLGSIFFTQWIGNDVIVKWVGNNSRSVPVFIWLKALTVVFAPLSGGVMYVLAPTLWPGWLAVFYVTIGNAIGIILAYRLGYKYADKAIGWFVWKRWLEQAHAVVDKIRGYKEFLIVRIVLFPLEDLLNFVAGMARVPFWWFFVVSMVITTLLFVLFVVGFAWIKVFF